MRFAWRRHGVMNAVREVMPAVTALFAMAVLFSMPVAGAPSVEPIVQELVTATSLALQPAIPYEEGILQIVGPDGYEVRKRFAEGVTLTADLVADRAPLVLGPDLQHEGRETPRAVLPDGRYQYEVALVDAGGVRRVATGAFSVRDGGATPLPPVRGPLPGDSKPRRTTGEKGLTSVTAAATTANDLVDILDDQADDYTSLRLWNFLGPELEADHWSIDHAFGDLRFDYIPFGGSGGWLAGLTNQGSLGLGTVTPAQKLEVRGSIRSSNGAQKMDLVASPFGLWLNDDDNQTIAKFEHSAPENRLAVTGTGVGIDTATPSGNLHIFGPANADLFAGMGPDLATGPAFNFGYAGTSFGRGAGFFNVRPDAMAAAPNPSLRFATANVQRMIVDNEGNIAFGANVGGFDPADPLVHVGTNARLTAAGIWTNGSSRAIKQNILPLEAADALATLERLEAVRYRAKADPSDEQLGFIAEDVPELVAIGDRTGLSPMDFVAVLTTVVQQQQALLREQGSLLAAQRERLAEQGERLAALDARIEALVTPTKRR